MHLQYILLSVILFLSGATLGCRAGTSFQANPQLLASATNTVDGGDVLSDGTMPSVAAPANSASAGELKAICSKLNFQSVVWPSQFTSNDRIALQLSLNISGSFEGSSGWGNITNNFDGQGLSLGLLNQTLGTGSMQPLLVNMKANQLPLLQMIFSRPHLDSFLGMIASWQAANPSGGIILSKAHSDPFNEVEGRLSPLDLEPVESVGFYKASEDASVRWAENTLYNGSSFIPLWKTELVAMAKTPEYVSLQIAAALKYHTKALGYLGKIGVMDLRAYLMLFDIVVQNGGLYAQDLQDYATAVRANPRLTAREKLVKIIDLRLRHVNPQWVEDVRSRKTALIDGHGVVHASNRNFEREYCYMGLSAYP